MANKGKELFIQGSTGKKFYAKAQNNITALVPKSRLPDSDSVIIENKRGYRFKRDVRYEEFCEGYYYFSMI